MNKISNMESLPMYYTDSRTKMSRAILSREVCLKFIKRVEFFECLWNRNAQGYKNPITQLDAWITLAKEFGVPYQQLRQKWRSLQGSFRHFNYKFQAANASGESPPNWFAFNAMQFLNFKTYREPMMDLNQPPSQIHVNNLPEPCSREESPEPGPSTYVLSAPSSPPLRIIEARSLLPKTPPPQTIPKPKPPQTIPVQKRGRTMKRRLEEPSLPYNRNMLKVLENVSAVTDRLVEERQTVKSDGKTFGEWVGDLLDEWSPDRRQSAKVAIRRFLAKKDSARYRERMGRKVEKMYESSDSDSMPSQVQK
ncbi:transcription factor Adf-1-like [Anopheles darlingi]|uniref:transcription factor Adf-1-like n=1 Tax=Anopheles darlingi TaxID=43151 RepID=UPI0021001A36|nr:transcription factor Adf-1-like [Anopheles darlingi]